MIEIQLLDRDDKPVSRASMTLCSIPYEGAIQDIAVITNENGFALFDCESVEGVYVFTVALESGEIQTLKGENILENRNRLILKLHNHE